MIFRRKILATCMAMAASLSYGFITEEGNGYRATTDVEQTMNLAFDIKGMRDAGVDFDAKKTIYENGENAVPLTLQMLSKRSGDRWPSSPIYNIYRHEFTVLGQKEEHDTLGNFDGSPAEEYADRLVQDLFDLQISHIEAEGAVVFHVYMSYLSELFDMLHSCWTLADGSAGDPADEVVKMNEFLDQAAALYVGGGQQRGNSDTGYMLYNLAQVMGDYFGQDTEGDEVKINRLVIELLHSMQTKVNENRCATLEGYALIRSEVKLLVKYANAILVQMLLHRVEEDNDRKADFVEMYTLAIMPHIAICSDSAHDTLLRNAVVESITDSHKATIISTLQSVYSCMDLNCAVIGAYAGDRIPQCDDSTATPDLAGFTPVKDVRKASYIDRDIRQMGIFMAYGDFKSAYDWYRFGWNSNLRLQSFALDADNDAVNLYLDQFQDERYYPDAMIVAALDGSAPFQLATNKQREGLVKAALNGIVMFWAIVEHLEKAGDSCEGSSADEGLLHWDTAAALYVGSTEGEGEFGQDGGQLLYGVSKVLCDAFQTCEPDVGSTENAAVLASFTTGQQILSDGTSDCAGLDDLTEDMFHEIISVIIQGFLYSAARVAEGADEDTGALLAYSRSIIPEIKITNLAASNTIDSNSNYFFEATTTTDIEATVGAVAQSLITLDINCEDLGDLTVKGQKTGICVGDTLEDTPTAAPAPAPTVSDPTRAPVQVPPTEGAPVQLPVEAPFEPPVTATEHPTRAPNLPETKAPIFVPDPHADGIAWGRYTFSSDTIAESDSKFTLDIMSMHDASTPMAAMLVYNQSSQNSDGLSSSGDTPIKSLKEFSTRASPLMSEDAMYNFYRVALYEDDSFDDVANSQGWPYAHSVVELALAPENGNDPVLGSRAAVVMNIWMLIVHRLYESVRMCKSNTWSGEMIDSAVALWIGQNQGEGKFRSGWSMYRVAQDAAMMYGNPEREAPANEEVLTLLVALQQEGAKCDGTEGSYLPYKFLADETIRLMSVPLLQSLLYHISEDNFEYVELYALAFIPQTISCNEGWYYKLRDTLYTRFVRDTDVNEDFVETLSSTLICLRMECVDLGDATNSGDFLKGLVSNICTHLTSAKASRTLAGYEITTFEEELERIDLDIHQMELFLRVSAYDLAKDLYENGKNMVITGNDQLHSLKGLTETVANMNTGGLSAMYQEYFASSTFLSDVTIAALNEGDGTRYDGASRRQLAEAAQRNCQVLLSYFLVVGKLHEALEKCPDGSGEEQVDEAVAFFVGSMEGRKSGGDSSKEGKLLYALTKEACEPFGCPDGTNSALLVSLSEMKKSIQENNCQQVESDMDAILTRLQLPLVQGTLYFANYNVGLQAQARNASLASADVISRSILPVVAGLSSSSAATISENMEFSRSQKPVMGGVGAVFDAFASVVPSMGLICDQIGSLGGFTTCVSDSEPKPQPDTPTNLGDDLYVTTTYVKDRADIALDVKDMEDLLKTQGREDQALLIYEEGKHSTIYDDLGKQVDLRSLQSFSTGGTSANPLFMIAVFALKDDTGNYRGATAWHYADTVVRESITKSTVASEAAVALNLWMELAKELYHTLTLCKNNQVADADSVKSIDEAVAYWIGDGQIGGDPQRGHLLYALAEKMGEHFGLDESGQSRTNINILRLFHQAKLELSLPGACSDKSTVHRVRHVVNKIITQMITVNVQALIHYLRVDDRDRVWAYAHGVVPLVAACSPDTFSYLRGKLLDGQYSAGETEAMIQSIYSVFPCFGMQCDDIGTHSTESTSTCRDPPRRPPLAGYTPSTDVTEEAKIDLDILEMEILMEMGAYEAAQDLYNYGKHVSSQSDSGQTALSLQTLARHSEKTIAPEIEAFKVYFEGDEKYADSLVAPMFYGATDYDVVERRIVATGTCRYMVLYAAALDNMYEAIEACESDDSQEQAIHYWDKAAAYMIGHLEGTEEAGSKEGVLFWGLANSNCQEFGTCSNNVPGSSFVNDRISTLLYSGRGAILGSNCGELKKAKTQLIPLLQTPLVQASLSSVSKLQTKNGAANTAVKAKAHVYSLAVLPAIADKDRESANLISRNMKLENDPLTDGAQDVAAAFAKAMSNLGVDCKNVGSSDVIDSCTGDVKSKNVMLIIGIVVAATVVLLVCCAICGRQATRKSEETTSFIASSNGEFNHGGTMEREDPEQARNDENLFGSDSGNGSVDPLSSRDNPNVV